jgi:hypothetical protein
VASETSCGSQYCIQAREIDCDPEAKSIENETDQTDQNPESRQVLRLMSRGLLAI